MSGGQSIKASMLESVVDTIVGFGLAFLVSWVVMLALGIPGAAPASVLITGILTVVSLGRKLLIRRLFNGYDVKNGRRQYISGPGRVRPDPD